MSQEKHPLKFRDMRKSSESFEGVLELGIGKKRETLNNSVVNQLASSRFF